MPRYLRLTLSGTLAAGAEAWSTSVCYQDPNQIAPSTGAEIQAWATACAAAVPTAVTSQLSNLLSTQGKITQVKTYEYEAVGQPADRSGAASVNFSGGATPAMPLQTAMVLSLRTGRAGRSYRGRLYWPAQGASVMSGGRFSSSDHTGAVADVVLMLQAFADAWPATGAIVPVIVSASQNAVTPVTSVQVGDVPDTQRRRRDALVENYVTEDYP